MQYGRRSVFQVPVDVRPLASGRYVYQMQAGPYQASRILVIQK